MNGKIRRCTGPRSWSLLTTSSHTSMPTRQNKNQSEKESSTETRKRRHPTDQDEEEEEEEEEEKMESIRKREPSSRIRRSSWSSTIRIIYHNVAMLGPETNLLSACVCVCVKRQVCPKSRATKQVKELRQLLSLDNLFT